MSKTKVLLLFFFYTPMTITMEDIFALEPLIPERTVIEIRSEYPREKCSSLHADCWQTIKKHLSVNDPMWMFLSHCQEISQEDAEVIATRLDRKLSAGAKNYTDLLETEKPYFHARHANTYKKISAFLKQKRLILNCMDAWYDAIDIDYIDAHRQMRLQIIKECERDYFPGYSNTVHYWQSPKKIILLCGQKSKAQFATFAAECAGIIIEKFPSKEEAEKKAVSVRLLLSFFEQLQKRSNRRCDSQCISYILRHAGITAASLAVTLGLNALAYSTNTSALQPVSIVAVVPAIANAAMWFHEKDHHIINAEIFHLTAEIKELDLQLRQKITETYPV